MKCKHCGSENISIDVTITIPCTTINKDRELIPKLSMSDIKDYVAGADTDDIKVFCYDCGNTSNVDFYINGKIFTV